jgi:SAM-dependent methyltransferase
MARRFRNPRRWAKVFDGRRRDRWQRPDVVLSRLGLKPAMRVADIGAGTGYFAVRFGQALPRGRVWAIDVEAEMVTYLNARARKLALPQVAAIQGGLDDPRIPEPVDIVFLCNTYHHISNRVAYFRNVRQQVAPQGRLVIVDFRLGRSRLVRPSTTARHPHSSRASSAQLGSKSSRSTAEACRISTSRSSGPLALRRKLHRRAEAESQERGASQMAQAHREGSRTTAKGQG